MRIVVAAAVAAIVLFFFGFLWWGVLMPIVRPASVISDAALVEQMQATLPETALYFYPDYDVLSWLLAGAIIATIVKPAVDAAGTATA